jgi:hypothetical protein
MDGAAFGAGVARRLGSARESSPLLAVFAGTLFLSAFLLFSVQPMFARMALPQLGGSPSVWAVSMCFFQAMLLAGYCYAHLVNRLVPARLAPLVHLSVMGVAVLTLPIGLPAAWSEPPAGDAYLWLMGLLAAGVGLPFFAVSANAPLLQAWFARSGHPHARDPYFLYGASNVGSLVALLGYPVLIEPFAGLGTQAALWTVGFLALGVAILTCALLGPVQAHAGDVDHVASLESAAPPRPTSSQRLAWVALAFVPSGLLVAFTSHVTTDIASAPFLWVIPLAMFLGTFILVFRDVPLIPHRTMLLLQPVAVVAVVLGLSLNGNRGWVIAAVTGAVAFFVTTMVCHKELYDRRPASAHLTEYYLWMSLGGVLGGIFAALVAPQIFSVIWEFPLLLVLGAALRPGVFVRQSRNEATELACTAGAALLLMLCFNLLLAGGVMAGWQSELARSFFIVGCGLLAVVNAAQPLRQLAFIALAAIAIVVLPSALNRGHAERSFFGVHRVMTSPDGKLRLLMHGTTLHGVQRIRDAEGPHAQPLVPTAYYYPGSPNARGAAVARLATAKSGAQFRAGVVGLGAGVMACNAQPGEHWRFFEIDPVVVEIARDGHRFTFLSTCQRNADIVLGDARLKLTKEAPHSFDYLLIDAFSSDAVPVHLLTREAISLYLDNLTPNGILALHVSNRHLDLRTVAAATAKSIPETFVALAVDRFEHRSLEALSSEVVFVTRSRESFELIKTLPYVHPVDGVAVAPWSDDFSDIVSAIWRKSRS